MSCKAEHEQRMNEQERRGKDIFSIITRAICEDENMGEIVLWDLYAYIDLIRESAFSDGYNEGLEEGYSKGISCR